MLCLHHQSYSSLLIAYFKQQNNFAPNCVGSLNLLWWMGAVMFKPCPAGSTEPRASPAALVSGWHFPAGEPGKGKGFRSVHLLFSVSLTPCVFNSCTWKNFFETSLKKGLWDFFRAIPFLISSSIAFFQKHSGQYRRWNCIDREDIKYTYYTLYPQNNLIAPMLIIQGRYRVPPLRCKFFKTHFFSFHDSWE